MEMRTTDYSESGPANNFSKVECPGSVLGSRDVNSTGMEGSAPETGPLTPEGERGPATLQTVSLRGPRSPDPGI